VPVVSVGNLCLGGGGKTPFTAALARRLSDRGARVVVLSRGYRRSTRGPLVVSRGDGPLLSAEACGDEPHLLARSLPGVGVVVAERRIDGGRLALETLEPRPDLILLDDGFAHVALARDVDLLLFPASDPWGGGRLPPGGRLREPLAAARHADAVVLTGAGGEGDEGPALAEALRPFGFEGPGFASRTEARPARLDGGDDVPAGTAVFAVAAIARPGSFFASARAAGYRPVGQRAFRDHAAYSARRLAALERAARDAGAAVVLTTEKDLPKLAGRIGLPVATLPIEARPEPELGAWLEARLAEAAR